MYCCMLDIFFKKQIFFYETQNWCMHTDKKKTHKNKQWNRAFIALVTVKQYKSHFSGNAASIYFKYNGIFQYILPYCSFHKKTCIIINDIYIVEIIHFISFHTDLIKNMSFSIL